VEALIELHPEDRTARLTGDMRVRLHTDRPACYLNLSVPQYGWPVYQQEARSYERTIDDRLSGLGLAKGVGGYAVIIMLYRTCF
jgi:hypothetical protein